MTYNVVIVEREIFPRQFETEGDYHISKLERECLQMGGEVLSPTQVHNTHSGWREVSHSYLIDRCGVVNTATNVTDKVIIKTEVKSRDNIPPELIDVFRRFYGSLK